MTITRDSRRLGRVRTVMVRLALVCGCVVACSSRHAGNGGGGGDNADARVPTDGDGSGPGDAITTDATHDATTVDAFPAVLDVRIDCHNDCTLIADPPSISVMAGTEFKVNWINVGDTECDVAKIDRFNQVPIILGLEPGMSYLDPVHEWCGQIFTGTFQFQISICTLPSDIPVDCGG